METEQNFYEASLWPSDRSGRHYIFILPAEIGQINVQKVQGKGTVGYFWPLGQFYIEECHLKKVAPRFIHKKMENFFFYNNYDNSTGVHQVPEGSGEQGKMEGTGCEIICGAPTTLTVKG